MNSVKVEIKYNVLNPVRHQVWNHVSEKIWDQVRDNVWDRYSPVWREVREELENEIG